MKDKARFSTSIELARYVFSTHKNWDNFDLNKSANNNVIFEVENNDNDENIGKRPSDNQHELYSIYDL